SPRSSRSRAPARRSRPARAGIGRALASGGSARVAELRGKREATGEVVHELARGPPRAARALQREAQRLRAQPLGRTVDASLAGVVGDDAQIGRLVEAVVAEHEAEAVGQRELLLERLAEVQLARFVEARLAVVAHALGEQVAAVAGRDDAHVLGRRLEA